MTLDEARTAEVVAREEVIELRRAVFESQQRDKVAALVTAERTLAKLSEERARLERSSGRDNGAVVAVPSGSNLLGPEGSSLDVDISLRMAAVPTALVHLYDADTHPLVTFKINSHDAQPMRLRLISFVEHYSARAVSTVELQQLQPVTVNQLPTFFSERLDAMSEMTRATLNVQVQTLTKDSDAGVQLHKTVPLWLLARTTAPLQMKDPATGTLTDLTAFLGAFVTPNDADVMAFLPSAVVKHPQQRFVGYQSDEEEVTSQVRAIYDALNEKAIKYINSIITFTADPTTFNQRVRLPRETLATRSANCIDGTLLFASLLEAISLNPAIVIIPGHAFLAWERKRGTNTWRYLETTMMNEPFDAACDTAEDTMKEWLAADTDHTMVKLRSLRDLRAAGITPRG